MSYRFAASKKSFELTSIEQISAHSELFIIKQEGDYKGIGFGLVWDRLSTDVFKLSCYHKGVFSEMNKEFREIIDGQPFNVINTILLKELFNVIYKTDPLATEKDQVYSEELKFKFLDLFEDESSTVFYIAKLVENFNWKLQIKEEGFDTWEDYII
jgi:hypothetical protein